MNNKIIKNITSFTTIVVAVAVTVYYLTFGGIKGNDSALSTVGLSHPILFSLWGISTYIALAFNIHIAFKKTKFKFYIILLIISAIGMALTLTCDFDYDIYPQYLAHCIGSLAFSAVTGITVFLAFLLNKKYILTAISGLILLTDLVMLLIFKETALIEIVPIFSGYILLLINNFDTRKDKIGTVQ